LKINIRAAAEEQRISFGSCKVILTTDLGMRRVSAKFAPRLLTAEKKEHCFSAASYLIKCAGTDKPR